ncbi:copper chaperone PCu(A)C [Lysobacter sp. A421]
MKPFRVPLAAVLLATAFSTPPVIAADCSPVVTAGWVRLPPISMPMLAGFGTIDNACDAPVTVIAASSPAFADVSLHETRIVDGISKMRAVPELVIPAHGHASLEPGGLHLMLMDPHAPLQADDTVVIDFRLEDGTQVRGLFLVSKSR